MRLKRIEIKGFKSFANETVIHFGQKVTGIVGPNGSGKSNIVDAIRWVLGEQKSRDLRLESMSDVIFNGTRKKRRGSYAKVTIVFDNNKGVLESEYSEVSIARKLNQEGDSEYFLNNTACRLKDIKSLLIDTGIGSHSYAIIALGMVDDILADKDDSRRKMFEQASGIAKFKKRKHQSKLKLKSTNADLERIEDLLHELKSQLRSLKRQANRAEKYLKIKKQYRENSIELALIRTSDLTTRYKKLARRIEEEQDQYHAIDKKSEKLEEELESKKKSHSSYESQMNTSQSELKEVVDKLQRYQNEKQMAEQRTQFAEKSIKESEKRIEQSENSIKEINKKRTLAKDKVKKQQEVVDDKEAFFSKLKQDKVQAQAKYDKLSNRRSEQLEEQQELERKILKQEQKIAIEKSRLQDVDREIEQLQSEVSNLVEDHSSIADSHSQKVREIDELEASLKKYQTEEEERKEKLEEVEKDIEEKQEAVNKIHRKLDSTENEYQLTKDLVEKLEGFPESIKYLNQNKEWENDAELFSDILFCREEYRNPIENYLNPYLSYYVVKNPEHALNAIELLKGAQKGKAQFFINSFYQSKPDASGDFSGLISASDCVEVEARYRNLIFTLLDDVYIMKESRSISSEDSDKYSDITVINHDGTIIMENKRISGGSAGLFEGSRLGRKKNLEKLSNRLGTLKHQLDEEEEILAALIKERQRLRQNRKKEDLDRLRGQLEKQYREGQKLALQLDQYHSNKARLSKKENSLIKESKVLAKSIDKAKNSLQDIKSTHKSTVEKMKEVNDVYSSANQQISSVSEEFNEANIDFLKSQNYLENLKNDLKYFDNQTESLKKDLKKYHSEKERYQRDLKEDQNLIEEYRNKIIKISFRKDEFEESLSQIEKKFFAEQKEINDIRDKLSATQKNLQKRQFTISELKDKFSQLKMKLSNISERIRVEFEINLDVIINSDREPDENTDPDKLEEEVESLRSKLSRFGEVNPMALEAYEEMKERNDLFEEQREDILEAQKDLEQTIREIEKRATERFMQSFDGIRTNFISVFRTLFTDEDDCDLILSDPDDPLESEIEIIAKPKGKKPKSLSQLSGGEKTLTATALLFALYLLKPAPFCIFDEVDAPLDDANLAKFNNIIREFSEESQFVIVTHSKHTMAEMDVIYGVFMDEPGVSGVSAVDFREYEHKGMFEKV